MLGGAIAKSFLSQVVRAAAAPAAPAPSQAAVPLALDPPVAAVPVAREFMIDLTGNDSSAHDDNDVMALMGDLWTDAGIVAPAAHQQDAPRAAPVAAAVVPPSDMQVWRHRALLYRNSPRCRLRRHLWHSSASSINS